MPAAVQIEGVAGGEAGGEGARGLGHIAEPLHWKPYSLKLAGFSSFAGVSRLRWPRLRDGAGEFWSQSGPEPSTRTGSKTGRLQLPRLADDGLAEKLERRT